MFTANPNQSPNLARGYLVALVSAGFLSTTSILIRYLTETFQIPALILAFWRNLFVVLSLILVLRITKPALLKVKRRYIHFLLSYGFVLAVFNSLWTLSVSLNGASISTVLAYSSAGFTALLGWWFFKESMGWGKILAISLALSGCVFVSGAYDPLAWTSNLLGIITGILSGLAYAIYTLMGRKASQDGIDPWTTLLYTFAFAAIFLFITNLTVGPELPGGAKYLSDMLWLGDQTIGWVILFLLAAVPTLVGFGLYNVSLVDLPSSVANLVVTIEPVFTALIAYFFLFERMGSLQIIGGILILGGVIFLRIYESRITIRSHQ